MSTPAAARAVSKLTVNVGSPSIRASRVRPAARMQCLSFHSTTATDSTQSPMRRTSVDTSSLRDQELDPQHWGYRVVMPGSSRSSRSYATSSISPASISYSEDYDDYTLYGGPSESVQCDLGDVVSGNDFDAILQFDDAGLVRPIWEQIGSVLDEDNEAALTGQTQHQQEESLWTMQSHSDNHSHDTIEPSAVATNGI